MTRSGSRLYWVEVGLASLSGFLALLTIVSREWIEVITGLDPDNGDGSLEWLIVAGAGAASVLLFLAARHEWRRMHLAVERG